MTDCLIGLRCCFGNSWNCVTLFEKLFEHDVNWCSEARQYKVQVGDDDDDDDDDVVGLNVLGCRAASRRKA